MSCDTIQPGPTLDVPPHSRILALVPKEATTIERQLYAVFNNFGAIESFQQTGPGTYVIKFTRTSQTMRAYLEAPFQLRGLKLEVLLGQENAGCCSFKELCELYLCTNQLTQEGDIRDLMDKFGKVRSIDFLRSNTTGQYIGLSKVCFENPIEAALAYEYCAPSYNPRFNCQVNFTEIMKRQTLNERGLKRNHHGIDSSQTAASSVLKITGEASAFRDFGREIKHLFTIPSGFIKFTVFIEKDHALAEYEDVKSAQLALDKLNGFPYPPGNKLNIQFLEKDESYSLYLVSSNGPFPQSLLEELFSKYGNLISVGFITGKYYGHAIYSKKENALQAMTALHGYIYRQSKLIITESRNKNPSAKKQKISK